MSQKLPLQYSLKKTQGLVFKLLSHAQALLTLKILPNIFYFLFVCYETKNNFIGKIGLLIGISIVHLSSAVV